jgi:hypothetical protein
MQELVVSSNHEHLDTGAQSWSADGGNGEESENSSTTIQEILDSKLLSAIEARFDLTKPQTCPCSIVSRIDQRSIVLYLHLKGLSAHAIHDDLVATLGPKAVVYSRVTRYRREAKLSTAEVSLDPESSSPHLDDSDRAILAALDKKPFSSMRELARATHIPRASVYRRITKSLWFVRYPFPWVSHLLSDAQTVKHVELCLSFLRMLEVQEQRAWHDLVTLDEL